MISAVGSGVAESSTRYEQFFLGITIETSTKEQFVGTFLGTGSVNRSLTDETRFYFEGSLLSKRKTTGIAHFSNPRIYFDVDADLLVSETYSERLYAIKINSNNYINAASLKTKGKHFISGTYISNFGRSLKIDMEADLAQPRSLGNLSYFEKMSLNMTTEKQLFSLKIVSPVYTTTAAIESVDDFSTYPGTFKVSAKSPAVFLEYDVDAVGHTLKAALTHTDVTMDIQHVIQFLDESPVHTLNVNISSLTF